MIQKSKRCDGLGSVRPHTLQLLGHDLPLVRAADAPEYLVAVPYGGGVGVLVGNFVLTAAHCVSWTQTGPEVICDIRSELIQTAETTISTGVLFVDPVSDIAVLGGLDPENCPDDAQAFEGFCNSTTPIQLSTDALSVGQELCASIRDADGSWIEGTAMVYQPNLQVLSFESPTRAKRGSSGGPILNENGELLCLFSASRTDAGRHWVHGVRPTRALPKWVLDQITDTESVR